MARNSVLKRHAYLIMAHHEFDFLALLLQDIDDLRNDIFLHVDVKAKGFEKEKFEKIIKNANLFIVPRMNVHWGGVYSD